MEKIKSILSKLNPTKDKFLSFPIFLKIGIIVLIVGLGIFAAVKIKSNSTPKVTYQTEAVQKGTFINSISGSGTITSGNYTNVSTKVSGIVSKVYVTNGDKVVKGQKIADVTLDDYARERQTSAWVAYLQATEAVKDAQTAKVTADINMWKARETQLNAETDVNNSKGDTPGEQEIVRKTLDEARLAFSSTELKYLNADSDVSNAQAKVSAAFRDYQQNSATIVAPSSGTISDLALAAGVTVAANSSTSQTTGSTIVSSQTVGKINDPKGQLIAQVSLTEIDVLKVKANQKVTLTLDSYPDKTFTGKVLAVNTSGSVSQGVTSYPVTILLDPVTVDIYPNMAVSVEITTEVKTDVILVPTTAIQTLNNQSVVQVMKNGKPTDVTVETGSTNDSQTEITSGLSEGDIVVTATINSQTTTSTSTTTSPFSGIGRTSGTTGTRTSGTFGGPGF